MCENDFVMEKKAKRFVRLLAKRLKEHEQTATGADFTSVEQTQQAFRTALDDLPECPLKSELQRKAATYSRKLEALMKTGKSGNRTTKTQDDKDSIADDLGPSQMRRAEACAPSTPRKSTKTPRKFSRNAEEGSGAERTDDAVAPATQSDNQMDAMSQLEPGRSPSSRRLSFPYNAFASDAKTRVPESLAKLPWEQRRRLAPHAYASLCSSTSFGMFLPLEKLRTSSDMVRVLQQEVMAGLRTSDAKVFIRTMSDCLSGVMFAADAVLETQDSVRLKELQAFILNLLQWAKTKHKLHTQTPGKQALSLTSFEDLMVAILSIYVDTSVVLSRPDPDTAEAEGRRTMSKILLLLGRSPLQLLNLLLQVSVPTAQDCRFMMPMYKEVLMAKPSVMTNEAFIKYACAVRFSRQVLQDQAGQGVLQDILDVAATTEPSVDFLQWLHSVAPEAHRSLPHSVQSTASLLVKYLTEQASRDYLDRLLDIVCDVENESQTLSYTDSRGDPRLPVTDTRGSQADAPETEGMFFMDTGRDEDLVLQDDSDSESADALHDRLDALIAGLNGEEISEDNENEEVVDEKPPSGKARRNVWSLENGTNDSDCQSDHDEPDMDVSGNASEQTAPESLSFEERRCLLKRGRDASGATKSDAGSTQRRRGQSGGQKTVPLSLGGGGENVARAPETQAVRQEGESDRESFTTAKDNLDSTRESFIIDVDDEITFNVKVPRREPKKGGAVAEEDAGGEEGAENDEDEVLLIEDVADECKQDEENDCGKGKNTSGESCAEAQTGRSQNSQESGKGSCKKRESSGSHKAMTLRSVSNARTQSSLLRFFTPVSRNTEDSNNNSRPVGGTKTDEVLVVPNSCSSTDDETRSAETERGRIATPRRISTDFGPVEPADGSQRREKKTPTPAPKKQNRLSRSARKAGSARKQIRVSSDGGEEYPAERLSLNDKQTSKTSEQPSPAEHAVSRKSGPRRKECETASSNLQQPLDTEETRGEKDASPGFSIKQSKLSGLARTRGRVSRRMITSSDTDGELSIPPSPVFGQSMSGTKASESTEPKSPAVEDAVSEGIRRIWKECAGTSSDLQQPLLTRSASKKKPPKRKALTITGGVKNKSLAASTPRQPTKDAEGSTPAGKTASKPAGKRQGVSPLSPSKVQRAATFGNTYRMLAGISADSQTDPGSLPASQSQKTSSKTPRLRPKALEEMFDKNTPAGRKHSAKKQTAGSSQQSAKSKTDSPSQRIVKKTAARTPKPLQDGSASAQAKRPKKMQQRADGSPPTDALKSTKLKRKSTGTKT